MADLILEIGTEDLPPGEISPALQQLADGARAAFERLRLDVGSIKTYGTPRRLVLSAANVANRTRPAAREIRGPAAQAAFDERGRPTEAAVGFARSQGVPVGSLRIQEAGGRRYAIAVIEHSGRPARAVLPSALSAVAGGLAFQRAMRWGTAATRYARPVRWVLALLDQAVLPVEVAGIRAGRRTPGHRFLSPTARQVTDAASYLRTMEAAQVMVDPDVRRRRIVTQATALAAKTGGVPMLDPQLLDETVMSVERPQAIAGAFARSFLTLPQPVLVTVMQHHQKYFPVVDRQHRLLPAFIAVRDGGATHLATVREGHEWVLQARLADAKFFFDHDHRQPLEAYLPKLEGLVFQEKLGTMADKSRRLQRLADHLAVALVLDGHTTEALRRAAVLCKADLVTQMVGEFPELQGTMGGLYAELDGEPAAVARAIAEHYRPAGAGDAPPSSRVGSLLALIDKCDTLAGGITSGLMPTGSQDPYGLRRAGQGITEIILAHQLSLPLSPLLRAAAGVFAQPGKTVDEAVEFLRVRLRSLLIDRGLRYDLVDAALAVSEDDLLAGAQRAQALADYASRPEFMRLYVAYDRASRILTTDSPGVVDPALFEHQTERWLHETMRQVAPPVEAAVSSGDFPRALRALTPLAEPVDRVFDDVLIMAPQPAVRANRLALLHLVVRAFRHVADFSKVVMADQAKDGTQGSRTGRPALARDDD